MAPIDVAFLNLLPTAAAITDRDGTLIASNEYFRALVRPRATGPEPLLRDLLSRAAENQDGASTQVHFDVAGQPHVALAAVETIALRQNETASIVTLHDITQQARRERELYELSLFPLMNPSPVLRLNRAGAVVLSNPAAERLFALGSLIGRSWESLCPGMTVALWQRVLSEAEPPSIESQIGAESVRFAHVVAPSGEVITAFGVVTTDFRSAERALDAKAKELAELARFPDMNPGPVIRTDFGGLILLANAAARTVFGDALVGMNWREVCPPVEESGWGSIVRASAVIAVEARLAGADYVFNHRSDPRSGFVFVYGTDITGQRRAERLLLQSDKMATLGTLAAGITHELNNPAAATRRAADQLRTKLAELTKAHLAFNPAGRGEDVRRQIDTLLELIKTSGPSVGELSAMEQSDREYAIESWLEDHGVPDPWQLGPDLVGAGIDPSSLSVLGETLDGPALASAIAYVTAVHNVATLSYTVTQGSSRISEIVGALKSY